MECNKDEALRAMEMAERKFAMQDYTAAKRLLLKAQQLDPTFENASRMLAVVEVHTIAQGKASGTEIDCYQLLQVDSSADDLIIKKNYRRLALMLHPDKNKSPGAEAAFKLVGEAWAVLSDKTKRWIYDTKRLPSGKEGTVNSKWNQSQGSSQTFSCNTRTFWTACSHCKMQYEYYRTYLNFNLKCQKCLRIFVANDIYSVSENGMNRPYGWPGSRADAQQSQAFKSQQGQNVHVGDNLPRSGTVPAAAKRVPNAAIGRENMSKANTSPNEVNKCQTVFEEVKINSGVARQKSSRNTEQDVDIVNNKRKEKEEKIKRSTKKQQTIDVLLMKRKKKEEESTANCQVEDPFNMKRTKKATLSDNQNGQEQDEEHKKLNKLVSDSQHRWHGAAVDSEIRRSSRARRDVDYNFDCAADDDLVAFPRSQRCDKTDLGAIAKSQKDSRPYLVHQNLERQPISDEHGFPVPDPDFYNFDQDRTEKSFGVGQIWAVYDDVNGMPSYYCRIMKVLTNTSFGVRMKWLEALPFSKNMFGKISGLSPACGKFEYSKKLRTENEINLFSHVMRVDSPNKDPVKIYPRRGEVWALFKDWDSEEFRSSTTDHAKNWKYEIVEILTEYSEDMGVNIASLVKLDGYTTVFTRQVKAVFKWFPSTELSRFSHMVPSWKIVGKGSVDGSWDLDPASLPLELMHEPTKPQRG